MDTDALYDGLGTTLEGIELISVIRSLTIVIDELLSAVDDLYCLRNEPTYDEGSMRQAFERSQIHYNLDLGDYEEEGLFILLKALLLAMTDALVNNKVFIYIQFNE